MPPLLGDWHWQASLPTVLPHLYHESEGDCATGDHPPDLVPCTGTYPSEFSVTMTSFGHGSGFLERVRSEMTGNDREGPLRIRAVVPHITDTRLPGL